MNRNKRAANRVAGGGEVRERTKRWLEAKGLKLNETKTRVVDIRQEGRATSPPSPGRQATGRMRLFVCLLAVTVIACAVSRTPLSFNIRATDVVSASAEPLDQKSVTPGGPDFRAQIHIVFNEDGARKFQQFEGTHVGQNYELQIEGKVLLPLVSASGVAGRDVWWFTTSMEQAQHFASLLTMRPSP